MWTQGIKENTDNVTGIKLDNFSVWKLPRKSEEEQGQNHTDSAQWKASFSSLSKRSWTEKFIGSQIPGKETWVNKDDICSMLLGLKTYKSNKKQGSHFSFINFEMYIYLVGVGMWGCVSTTVGR